MSAENYPLTLYRAGTAFDWDGRLTDSRVVADSDEHSQAAGEGWKAVADYFAPPNSGPGRPPKTEAKT